MHDFRRFLDLKRGPKVTFFEPIVYKNANFGQRANKDSYLPLLQNSEKNST